MCVVMLVASAVCGLGAQVRFDAEEALAELARLGLAEAVPASPGVAEAEGEVSGRPPPVCYRVCSTTTAMRLLPMVWEGVLWQRVDAILAEEGRA